MPDYFIKRGDKIRGPVSKEQLRKLKGEGKLKETDLISKRDDGGWKPILETRSAESVRSADTLPPRRNRSKEKRQPAASNAKKSLLIPGVAISTLAIVAVLGFLFWPSGADTEESVSQNSNPESVAGEPSPSIADSPDATANTNESTTGGASATTPTVSRDDATGLATAQQEQDQSASQGESKADSPTAGMTGQQKSNKPATQSGATDQNIASTASSPSTPAKAPAMSKKPEPPAKPAPVVHTPKPKRVLPPSGNPAKLFALQKERLAQPTAAEPSALKTSLREAIPLISKREGIPFWLNEATLRGWPRAKDRVTLRFISGPLGPQLSNQLNNYGLVFIPPLAEEGDWEITTRKDAVNHMFPLKYDVSDAVRQGVDFSQLIELIQSHVPSRWESIHGEGGGIDVANGQRKEFNIKQTWAAHDRITTLLEMLRLGPAFPVYKQLTASIVRLQRRIKGRWEFQQTKFTDVLAKIGQDEGIEFQVDEHELDLEGFKLQTPVTLAADNGSLGVNLDRLLKPLGLSLLPLRDDGMQWTVTSITKSKWLMLTIIHPVRLKSPPPYQLSPIITQIQQLKDTRWVNVDGEGGVISPITSSAAIGLTVTQNWETQVAIMRILK